MITIAIIEDNRLVREGITEMLNDLPDVKVVHAGTTLETSALKEAKPRVVLLDIGLHETDCLQAAAQLRTEMAGSHVVVMDLLPVHEELVQFVTLGVAGFILKDATFDDFVATIRLVAAGERVLPPRMTSTLFSQVARVAVERGKAAHLDGVHMTHRELQVIGLISGGMSNKEIAQELSIATDTVKSHVGNIMEKLALHSRLQIAAYAHQQSA